MTRIRDDGTLTNLVETYVGFPAPNLRSEYLSGEPRKGHMSTSPVTHLVFMKPMTYPTHALDAPEEGSCKLSEHPRTREMSPTLAGH